MSGTRIILRILTAVCLGAALCASGWITFRTWPRKISLGTAAYPSVQFDRDTMIVPFPTETLLAEVGRFDDELSAYLWFDYLRSRPGVEGSQVVLTVSEKEGAPLYRIEVVVPNNALVAIPFLAQLEAKAFIEGFELGFSTKQVTERKREQTNLFVATYKRPVEQEFKLLPRDQLLRPMVHFLVFKSRTDPRVRGRDESRPTSLSHEQATELAADIVAVAEFYDLPLDVFLGIGAMENNYLSIRGDLNHAVWKRKAAKDDIILKRRRGRVLVSNYSIGVWQITRETLRYAHALYLTDKRDYFQLPERLRPPQTLELDLTNSHILTAYAGLLLRDLLDHFNGDVDRAVGAYNGGPRNPNLQYAAGVEAVAACARNILERVTAVNEQTATDTLERGISTKTE